MCIRDRAEAAQLPNLLPDVDYAVINSNYAINAGLNPVNDSLPVSYTHLMEELVKMAGGNVVDRIAVLAEGGAADRKDIKYLGVLPVFNADGSIK